MSVLSAVPRLPAVFSLLITASLLYGCAEDQDGDLGPASIAITYPEQDGFVNQSRFRVRGTADNAAEVNVNGTSAEVVDGSWEVLLSFEEGAQTVAASAKGTTTSADFTVDTVAPVLELDSPRRGLFVEEGEADEVTFAGTVSDEGSGLMVVALDGAAVSYDEAGSFSHAAGLSSGYNEFEFRVVDRAGNEATTRRGALYGPMAEPTAEIDSAAEIVLAPAALETATEVIEQLMTPERVTGFVQTSLADMDMIAVDQITFDSLDATLTPNSPDATYPNGYLGIEVVVAGFELAGAANFGGDDYAVTIALDEASVTTEVALAASDAGGLDLSFTQSVLELDEEHLHFSFADISEQDLTEGQRDTLRGVAVGAAKAAFSELLSDELFEQLYDPGVLRRQVELLGRTLEFQLYVRQVRTTADGVYLNASVAIVSPQYEGVPEAPGALDLGLGVRSAPGIDGDILFTTHRTAVNRLLHGAWRSGLLTLGLVGGDFAGYELPGGLELSAASLALLLDSRISSLDTSQTPAGLNLRPQLPPVAAFSHRDDAQDDGDIGLELGELLVDLELLPEDGEPIALATVALFVDLTAKFEARDGKLALGLTADARADLDQEPALDLDDQQVEELFVDLIELTTEMMGDNLELTAAAELEWLRIDSPTAEVHGEELDQLSVGAELDANAAGVE